MCPLERIEGQVEVEEEVERPEEQVTLMKLSSECIREC